MRRLTPATSGQLMGHLIFSLSLAPILFIMSNKTVIHKSYLTENFTSISNDLIFDMNLTMNEKSLLIFIISMPDDHILSKCYLHECLPDSKCSIDKAFLSLIDKGFIKCTKIKDSKGRFKGFSYEIFKTNQSKKKIL